MHGAAGLQLMSGELNLNEIVAGAPHRRAGVPRRLARRGLLAVRVDGDDPIVRGLIHKSLGVFNFYIVNCAIASARVRRSHIWSSRSIEKRYDSASASGSLVHVSVIIPHIVPRMRCPVAERGGVLLRGWGRPERGCTRRPLTMPDRPGPHFTQEMRRT
jgi:hypothetical protein